MSAKKLISRVAVLLFIAVNNCVVLYYSQEIKGMICLNQAMRSQEITMDQESQGGEAKQRNVQVKAAVILPHKLLAGDSKLDCESAKSYLSKDDNWQLVGEGEPPKSTGLKGKGFVFQTAKKDLAMKE